MSKKKILSLSSFFLLWAVAIVCVLALAFGSFGATSYAATTTPLQVHGTKTGVKNNFEDGTWTELTKGGTLSTGKYYLTSDVELSSGITISGEVTIDLNGYMLKYTGSYGSVITVNSGATFTLEDSNSAARTYYYTEAKTSPSSVPSTVSQNSESAIGSFNGGVITGGNDDGGGVNNNGTFNMYGGAIAGNMEGSGTAGGVNANGTFNMYGGAIVANLAENSSSWGAGVYVNSGTFTMYGGIIKDNVAGSNGRGGGVYVNGGTTFVMRGGEISGNTARQSGGGVCLAAYGTPSFEMSGGYIGMNTAPSGGNISQGIGTVTITGGFFDEGTEGNGGIVAGITVDSQYVVYRTNNDTWTYGVCSTSIPEAERPQPGDEPAPVIISVTASFDGTLVYDGNPITEEGFNITVTKDGQPTTDYVKTYSYSGTSSGSGLPTDAGTYTITVSVTVSGMYYGQGTFPLTINKTTNSWDTELAINGWTYNVEGTHNEPTYVAKFGTDTATVEYKLATAGDETYTTTVPQNAGNYVVRVTIAGTTNYTELVSTKEFTIAKAKVTAPTASTTTYTYTGEAQTYLPNGFDDSTMTISNNTRTEVGSQDVTVSLKDSANYEWSTGGTDALTFTFTIAEDEGTTTPEQPDGGDTTTPDDGNGPDAGVIVGISLGSIFAVALIAVGVVLFIRRKNS